jgi:oligopeptide transport system substrate-binding protein
VGKYAATLLILLALLIAAVTADKPLPRADFTFVNRGDVNTLDPQRMSWIPDLRVARLLFDPLVQNDVLSEDFGIIPSAAERWGISDDRRTYTFHLRPNGKWSNGEPVTAHDFVYSWRRAMLPDLASDYAAMFLMIEGGPAFFAWRAAELDVMAAGTSTFADGAALWAETQRRFTADVAIEAVDDFTLRFTLSRPVPYFLELCAIAVFAPVYPPLVERYEQPDPITGRLQRETGWTKPGQLVTNGRFMVESWRFKRAMRLAQNPHHWDRDALNVRTIAIQAIDDPGAAVLAFQSGVVDWIPDLSVGYRAEIYADKLAYYAEHADEVATLRARGLDPFTIDRLLPADPRAAVHAVPVFGTYWYNFNCSPRLPDGRVNPLADARVRRALAMCIDKRAITEGVRRLGEPIAGSVVPPGALRGYTPPKGLPDIGSAATTEERDAIVARARTLLAEAGYPDPAKDFPVTIELLFNEDAGHDLIAAVIAKSWAGALGIPVALAQKELKVFRDDLKSFNYVTSRGSWYGDYPDPRTFLDVHLTGDGNNDRNYSSARFDALIERAEMCDDPAERLAVLAEAERLIVEEDVPVVPIFHYVDVSMFDPHRITGLTPHPRAKDNVYLVDVIGDGIGHDEPLPMRKASP